jgi:hypothetical protein
MSVFDHDQEPGGGGLGRVLLIGGGVVALLGAIYAGATMLMPAKPVPKEAPPAVRSEPAVRPAPKPAESAGEPDDSRTAARAKPRPTKVAKPEPAPPPPPSGPVLVVESDVPGASVFIDRTYIGTTPLRSTEVTPGTHQLNASASGEEGLVQTVEIVGTGETTIALKFREVRLNSQLAAVHKHPLGSCAGTLSATAAGISYATDNKKDAFSFPLGDLEVFAIDYLKKELKVKQRGGRTWNFTDKSENADKLFVFHRDVSKAREKMVAQPK